jgi:hypothetical protein
VGFGVCPYCRGYWTSWRGFVNYCVCKPGLSPAERDYAAGWSKWGGPS